MRFIIIIILILPTKILFGQSTNDETKYLNAYEYLNSCEVVKKLCKKGCKKNANLIPINVLDSIYPISILILDNQIIEENLIKNEGENIAEFIVRYDRENDFEVFTNTDLFPQNDKSSVYVVFSKPNENHLLVEMMVNGYNLPESKLTHLKLTEFNKSLGFLFVFDNNGEIKQVFSSLNQYN